MSTKRSESRKATKLLNFRVTPEDFSVIAVAAAVRGMGPSAFARRVVFRAAEMTAPDYERAVNPVAANAVKIIGELGRIGNNVNQIARVANSTRGTPVLDALRELVAELRALRESVLRESEEA